MNPIVVFFAMSSLFFFFVFRILPNCWTWKLRKNLYQKTKTRISIAPFSASISFSALKVHHTRSRLFCKWLNILWKCWCFDYEKSEWKAHLHCCYFTLLSWIVRKSEAIGRKSKDLNCSKLLRDSRNNIKRALALVSFYIHTEKYKIWQNQFGFSFVFCGPFFLKLNYSARIFTTDYK